MSPPVERFALTHEHVALLRRAVVRWVDFEFGAPAIDCKRPYGNSSVLYDMAGILDVQLVKVDGGEEYVLEADADRLHRLHEETATALQVILATGSMEPGEYVADAYRRNWRRA
jgi:hypothetical protein